MASMAGMTGMAWDVLSYMSCTSAPREPRTLRGQGKGMHWVWLFLGDAHGSKMLRKKIGLRAEIVMRGPFT